MHPLHPPLAASFPIVVNAVLLLIHNSVAFFCFLLPATISFQNFKWSVNGVAEKQTANQPNYKANK